MDDRRITYFVTAVVCCLHLVQIIQSLDVVNISATGRHSGIHELRTIHEDKCDDIFERHNDTDEYHAFWLLINATRTNARDKCLAIIDCYVYLFDPTRNRYTYGRSNQIRLLVSDRNETAFVITLRCPIHNRCSNLPCKNNGTCIDLESRSVGMECICGDSWKGWYCETRKTCEDHPCVTGATCNDSASDGFICTCPALTTGVQCEVQITTATTTVGLITVDTTTVTEIAVTAPNTTVEESDKSGLTTDMKVVIGAAAAGGVVVAVVAASAAIGAASTTAGSTVAGAK